MILLQKRISPSLTVKKKKKNKKKKKKKKKQTITTKQLTSLLGSSDLTANYIVIGDCIYANNNGMPVNT